MRQPLAAPLVLLCVLFVSILSDRGSSSSSSSFVFVDAIPYLQKTTVFQPHKHESQRQIQQQANRSTTRIRGGSSDTAGAGGGIFSLNSLASLLDADPQAVVGLAGQFVAKQWTDANARRSALQSSTAAESASTVADPTRIASISLASLLGTELLHLAGVFATDPVKRQEVAQSARGAWSLWKEKAEPAIDNWQEKIRKWFQQERRKGGILHLNTWTHPKLLVRKLHQFPSRYQFAIGSGIGWILSPLIWTTGEAFFYATLAIYLFAEGNHALYEDLKKRSSQRSRKDPVPLVDEVLFEWTAFFLKYLDGLRRGVRRFINDPEGFIFVIRREWDDAVPDEFELPDQTRRGIAVGAALGMILGA